MYGIDAGLPPDPAPGAAAGWRPAPGNPNEEVLWDGTAWTARRRWTAAGYLDLPVNPPPPSVPDNGQGSRRRPGLRRTLVAATAVGVVAVVTAVVLVAVNHSHKGAGTAAGTLPGRAGSSAAGHLRWSAPVVNDPKAAHTLSGQLNYLSCPTVTFCMSANGDGYAITFDGHSWSSPVRISPYPNVLGVSCASPTFCVAVGGGGYTRRATYWQYQNGRWGAPIYYPYQPGYNAAAYSVSCPSSHFCATLLSGYSAGVKITTFDGRAWSRPSVLPESGEASSIDCPSATFCAAVGDSQAYFFDGANWRSASRPIDHAHVSISCPLVSFCVTSDAYSEVGIFDGRSWSRHQVDPAMTSKQTQRLYSLAAQAEPDQASVSCTSKTFCVLVDAIGHASEFDGVNWSRPMAIDPKVDVSRGNPISSVSCATTTFCVAIDANGNVMTTN
ncbi:MAG TPA: hypothetical protein VFU36_10865 [Jatrophihabitans sp.]|nr:hypothetical protein [Jatrophihabitans sp.]